MAAKQTHLARVVTRTVLAVLLTLALISLYMDRRARSLSEEGSARLSEQDATGKQLNATAVQELVGVAPASRRDVNGGLIEHYDFDGGLAGRTYRISVAYAPGLAGEMVYVEHNLNPDNGDGSLEESITRQGNRLSVQAAEEDQSFSGADSDRPK